MRKKARRFMGIISDLKALHDVQKIKNSNNSKTVKLSVSQVVNLIINLPDANRNLSNEDYNRIYSLYRNMRTCKTKIPMNYQTYIQTVAEIIKEFDIIAPYEAYSGGTAFETSLLMRDIYGKNYKRVRELRRQLADAENTHKEIIATYQDNSKISAESYTDEQLHKLVERGEFSAAMAEEYISKREALVLHLQLTHGIIIDTEAMIDELKKEINELLSDN